MLGDALRREDGRTPRHGDIGGGQRCRWYSRSASRRVLNNRRIASSLDQIAQGVKRGEGSPPLSSAPVSFRRWPDTCSVWAKPAPGRHVQSHGRYLRRRNAHRYPALHFLFEPMIIWLWVC
jgi:hypothetical protein